MKREVKNRRDRGTFRDPDRWREPGARRPTVAGARKPTVPGIAAVVAVLAAGLFAGLTPGPAAAQDGCDEEAGTLGIQGLRCEGCSYSMSENGIDEARFRTEPQVMAVVLGFTEGHRLRAGDHIVAIDGHLVTTRAGGSRLVNLEAGQALTLRVRRDGRVEELHMVAGSACALRRQAREGEVELERVAGSGYGVYVGEAPPAPPAPSAGVTVAPPLPPMPAMPAMPPSGYLGFGLTCGPCGVRDGTRFFDRNPPTVNNVVEDGPADRAGLRPDDVILAIDGLDITSAEGGRRFSELEPGDRTELTIRRGGEQQTLRLEAGERVVRRPAPGVMPPPPAPRRWSVRPDTLDFGDRSLTFENTPLYVRNEEGEVMIILRDAPVTIERDEATGEIVIRSGGRVIRLSRG